MPKALLTFLGVVGAGFVAAITQDAWHWLADMLASLIQ